VGKGDDVQEDGTHGYDDDARGDTLRQRRTGHPRESASITNSSQKNVAARARHLREHGDHLLSPYDPAEPAGAAGEAVVELSFNLVQVLTALRLLLLAMSTS